MSKFFAESNLEPLAQLFNKRVYYKSINSNSMIDFGAEKYLYGRVDRLFRPIYVPSTHDHKFKSLNKKRGRQNSLVALDFVVDAFNDLAQQFAKCVQVGNISPDDAYLSNIKAYRAYIDPKSLYGAYMSSYARIFRAKNNDIEDFDEVQPKIEAALKISSTSSPFTFPAFVKNRRTPINISGLAIEIADINCENDNAKMELFVGSKNWEFYLNAAKSFGFMVDLDVPWRLVADIGSSVMQKYAAAYGADNTDRILNKYYLSAGYQYALEFPKRSYDMYNAVKPRQIRYTQQCGNKTVLKIKQPRNYGNLSSFEEQIGRMKLLENYCRTRVLEEETNLSENEVNILIDDTLELLKSSSLSVSIDAFEQFLNKPFDYHGSLSYNINRNKLLNHKNIIETTATGY
jgi:hypothetical protein